MQNYSFDNTQTGFFSILRKKVEAYFSEHQLHPAGNRRLYWKGALQIISSVLIYTTLVFFNPGVWISLGLCVILGVNLAAIGFNVMHEGGHKTFSRYPWLNQASAHFLNVLGGTAYYWKVKHNINHHTYTNIDGMDSDIDVKPFMRLHEGQPLRWFHRFQHIYWVLLYGISYLAWVFYEDFQKYFSGKISAYGERKGLALKEHFIFWVTKVTYIGAYMVLPILLVGWLPWLVGFLIATIVCGLTTSIVFQLAHVVEGTKFHSVDTGSKPDWAIQQVISTANFSTSSKFLFWLLGGLNFQIEHHLFPRVSHIHYPRISSLVRETCREYNIAYIEYKSMFSAFVSHLMHLHRLGRA
jgi:linoleoyl-CoA desaturase